MHPEPHGLLLEYSDELLADDRALALRIRDAGELREEALLRVDRDQAKARTEGRDHLLGLLLAKHPRVHEHAGELVADRPGDERRRHRGVDATGQREDRATVADDALQLRDRLLHERGRRPIPLRAADVQHEVAEDLGAARRVRDLRMELHAEAARAVAHRRRGQAIGARDGLEAGRQRAHRVAVAHPRALRLGEPIEDPGAVVYRQRGGSEFALALGDDLATRKQVGHEVHAVADTEDREPAVEDRGVDEWRVLLVHARRTAREDHADHATGLQLGRRDVVRKDLAVDP